LRQHALQPGPLTVVVAKDDVHDSVEFGQQLGGEGRHDVAGVNDGVHAALRANRQRGPQGRQAVVGVRNDADTQTESSAPSARIVARMTNVE
jgi:hypothetical protein